MTPRDGQPWFEASGFTSSARSAPPSSDAHGHRPFHGGDAHLAGPWRDEILYHEYFHAETGQGMGAAHQPGWMAMITRVIEDVVDGRERKR